MVKGRSHDERSEEQRGFTPEEAKEIRKKAKKKKFIDKLKIRKKKNK